MAPARPLLWRSLRVFQIYGANTDVGKTVFATILSRAAKGIRHGERSAFLKPVSTGPLDDADDRHVEKHAPGVVRKTLFQYDTPVSPHVAARGKEIPLDSELLSAIYDFSSQRAAEGAGWLFIETAGGVHSPGPSGVTQADLYAALRCPVVLVADSKLGGISLTISAFESLKIRGYDVEAVLAFRDDKHDNAEFLRAYFAKHHGPLVASLPKPPPLLPNANGDADAELMSRYYQETSGNAETLRVLDELDRSHRARIERLESMPGEAHRRIWYPFTQHQLLTPGDIVAIDGARGDFFQTLAPPLPRTGDNGGTQVQPVLRPSFDGSASWWTQGLGHGNPSLALAAAYAAGRYGHVMFAGAVHEPALALARTLLDNSGNPRLTRVFYSDDGSTGVEVAVKMALRAARRRYGWSASAEVGVIGLRGGYHGDTIGAMDCAEPSAFNETVEWYSGRGIWLDYPRVKCIRGWWAIEMPTDAGRELGEDRMFGTLDQVFDLERRELERDHEVYESYIEKRLSRHVGEGRKFGALLMEPVVIGAGGMELVDPLFQRSLVKVVRRSAKLFDPLHKPEAADTADNTSWTGLPVIFDEVFTGLYRLGRFSAASFLGAGAEPDISVHAKLLTGGLVPLSATLASESVFAAFGGSEKADALLHGHSYTAHPVGCHVAVESLRQMRDMEARGEWDWAKRGGDQTSSLGGLSLSPSPGEERVWSIWPEDLPDWISHQTRLVAGTWALGSVLAIHMDAPDGLGYKSNAALNLQRTLRDGGDGGAWNVHSRVLGNVLYLMGSQKTTQEDIAEIANLVRRAFSRRSANRKSPSPKAS
ncbi:hypothetical protein GGS23DRAFT_555818 [Durotheca rogersii]|uniref:uncharacterized protein n=1 Tax=Durotheca rogersii TaxID=419775 RepID=UPI002220D634|nr:uncharacterized protein GGS23DRAFT_555818 [Durotheca rogersii]KAI5866169.1 hypothetical protein GGS23DRAFT_555818 [Durotheca rogersii]